jgi:dipeptidyl aminopeptidase/acylaminoacyl peptidase
MKKSCFALALFAASTLFAQVKPTPGPDDVPKPVPGDVSFAGATCPDISRYLNVRNVSGASSNPEGTRISYLTSITGQPQLWVSDVRGGGAWPRQITFGESVTFASWSPAGDWIAYGTDRGGNEREGYYLISPDGTRERELLPPSESFRVWGGFSDDGTRAAYASTAPGQDDFDIYVVDVATGKSEMVLHGQGGLYVAEWRPGGAGLLLTKTRGEDANDVFYLDLKTRKLETIFQPKEAAAYDSFSWTPDGSGFYLVSNEGRDFQGLAFYDFSKRALSWIVTPSRDVDATQLSRDGKLLTWIENANGFSELHIRTMADGTENKAPAPRGVISGLSWAPKAHRLLLRFSSPEIPGDVWVLDAGESKLVRATESATAGLNPRSFVAPEAVSFASHDGETIYGLLYMPRSAKADARPPVILSVHGGPTGQARPTFSAVSQYLLARGYAILDLNFRGSTGYGKRFTRLDNQRLRPNGVKDMQAAVEWLRRTRPGVDASRVAVMGGSYGGYMTFAALTEFPDTFKAGVGLVGVSNWITALQGASPQLKASDRLEYGNVDDPADREFFKEISPLTHVDRVKAPLMVVHGANDPRDPVTEADQFVRAIRERNGEVEYLRFPDEGHGVRKLANRVILYRRVAAFLERTLGPGVTQCGTGSQPVSR